MVLIHYDHSGHVSKKLFTYLVVSKNTLIIYDDITTVSKPNGKLTRQKHWEDSFRVKIWKYQEFYTFEFRVPFWSCSWKQNGYASSLLICCERRLRACVAEWERHRSESQSAIWLVISSCFLALYEFVLILSVTPPYRLLCHGEGKSKKIKSSQLKKNL